jgi:peptide/nickel transport system substrate-binding protein
MMRRAIFFCLGLLLIAAGSAHAAGTLHYGLEFDPDVLDPARDFSYTGRIVMTTMCDQLLDVDTKLNFVPDLATSWQWAPDNLSLTLHLREGVQFQDGTPFDADAMRANLERDLHAPESLRKAELSAVKGTEVVDPHTIRILLSRPFAPLLALMANRPGMPLSPKILPLGPDAIAAHPVCAGAFSFVDRVAQDHITLQRFPGYWDAGKISLDRVVFQTINSQTVRMTDLQAGSLDIADALAPNDAVTVQHDPKLRLVTSPSIGYQLISLNIGHDPGDKNSPLTDPRVREAFDKSLDRRALNDVVFNGQYIPNNQTEPPGSRYWNPDHPVPPRDLGGAKALLAEAGVVHPTFTLIVGNDPITAQVGEVIQSMAGEAGFTVKIQQEEGAAMVAAGRAGTYQASLSIWSGRPDPDQNASIWFSCKGGVNWTGYCDKHMDDLLAQGAALTDPAQRIPIYRQISDLYLRDRPYLVLYHFRWLWGLSDRVTGFVPYPDGLTRFRGLGIKQ